MFGYMGHPTDINVIPFVAIDHVEILKDGASAQYGADAVGGVGQHRAEGPLQRRAASRPQTGQLLGHQRAATAAPPAAGT